MTHAVLSAWGPAEENAIVLSVKIRKRLSENLLEALEANKQWLTWDCPLSSCFLWELMIRESLKICNRVHINFHNKTQLLEFLSSLCAEVWYFNIWSIIKKKTKQPQTNSKSRHSSTGWRSGNREGPCMAWN